MTILNTIFAEIYSTKSFQFSEEEDLVDIAADNRREKEDAKHAPVIVHGE